MNHLAKAQRAVRRGNLRRLKKSGARNGQIFGAVRLKHHCRSNQAARKIVIVGIGKSGNVGQNCTRATLTSTGSTSVVLSSVDALHGDVGIVNDGDVILLALYVFPANRRNC